MSKKKQVTGISINTKLVIMTALIIIVVAGIILTLSVSYFISNKVIVPMNMTHTISTKTEQPSITPQKTHGLSTSTPNARTTFTPFALTSPTNTLTGTPPVTNTLIVETPNATQTLKAAFNEVDTQFQNSLQSNIAFNKPDQMNKDEVTSIELILNPSLSASALSTQLVERGNFLTSTSEPNVLIAPSGERVKVESGQIEISPLMKAVLLPQDPEAFVINQMHNNAEQVISLMDTTIWRWSVTAKKEGSQTLELIIYQLVKYDGEDYWHEVETYKANIVVEVTIADRIKSLDWRWIAGFIITLIGAILAILKWLDDRKKIAEGNKPSPPPRRIK